MQNSLELLAELSFRLNEIANVQKQEKKKFENFNLRQDCVIFPGTKTMSTDQKDTQ